MRENICEQFVIIRLELGTFSAPFLCNSHLLTTLRCLEAKEVFFASYLQPFVEKCKVVFFGGVCLFMLEFTKLQDLEWFCVLAWAIWKERNTINAVPKASRSPPRAGSLKTYIYAAVTSEMNFFAVGGIVRDANGLSWALFLRWMECALLWQSTILLGRA